MFDEEKRFNDEIKKANLDKASIEELTEEQRKLYILNRVVDSQYREFNEIYLYIRETAKSYLKDLKEISSSIYNPNYHARAMRNLAEIEEGTNILEAILAIIHLEDIREIRSLKKCLKLLESEL